MRGFDSEFRNPPDYILGITSRIWEQGEPEAIRRFYSDDCPVRAPSGVLCGAEQTLRATKATLAEFPDRRLQGEDVIWIGDAQGGFLSSHRILSTATHRGDGAYGAASGRRLRYRVIADCVVRENQVREEWLVRDQGAIAKQLGKTAKEMAQAQIAAGDGGFYLPEHDDTPAFWRPVIARTGPAARYGEIWQELWGDKKPVNAYAEAAVLEAPGGMSYQGRAAIADFHRKWQAALHNPEFQIHHLFALQESGRPARAAMRWTIRAEAGGAAVFVMGISHAHIIDGRIAAEWIVTDEVALWKQILAAR